ncbi:MAG: response regulator [Caldisericia bacterium]|nr:response regulator [Caldisericia bacterium]
MKKKYFSIAARINICMVFIILIVLLSGFVKLRGVHLLWNQTSDMYTHPLIMSRALGTIQNEIILIQTDFQRLVLREKEVEKEEARRRIKSSEEKVFNQFDIVKTSFLGSEELVDRAVENFSDWNEKRDAEIDFILYGNLTEELVNKKKTSIDNCNVDRLRQSINKISEHATKKGDSFYNTAKTEKNRIFVNFILLLLLFLALVFWTFHYLWKSTQVPLDAITDATNNFKKGKYNTRCSYSSTNEFGLLSTAFNELAARIQSELINRENVRNITDEILKNENVETFALDLLNILMQKTKSQMGSIHLLNDAKNEYICVKSIGLTKEDCNNVSAEEADGTFGLAVLTKKVQYIEDIPEDLFMHLNSMNGKIRPKEMIVIPAFSKDKLIAIVSLANIHKYSSTVIRLIEDSKSIINARINNVVSFEKINRISGEVSLQNEELKIQKEELKIQTLEQNKQSIELATQQKELISANRLKSSFLSNMSHELRTPLNSVISLSSILIRKMKDIVPNKELEYMKVIQRNGQHLLTLINDILNISRIESGKEEIMYSTFSVKNLVDDTVEMILPQAQEKNVLLKNSIPDGLQHITSDMKKCQHILQNLIGNAVKFTEKGQVNIAAYIKNDFVNVTVSDTGIGIETRQMKYIFDEFRQIDDSITKKFEGTGLGLAIAKKYAVLLNGDIFVKSTIGKGSEFTMKLPLYKEKVVQNDEEKYRTLTNKNDDSKSVTNSLDKKEKTVLIVDDSEPAIIQLTDILEEENYKIIVARDGVEALEKVNKTKPDAIILDLMMPHIDGFQVLKTLRTDEKTLHLPVLVLTAKYITKKELDFLNNSDIFQLIQKGDVSKKQLLAVVNGMIRSEVYDGKE